MQINGTKKIDVINPEEIKWVKGDLPPISTIPKESCLLVWMVNDIPVEDYEQWKDTMMSLPDPNEVNGTLRRIILVHPWENELNPLRWCDSNCYPIGFHEKVAWYAWIKRGKI